MKLFYTPGACSLTPHIVLRETGLDFTLVRVDLKTKMTEQGEDYLHINPKGQVPGLLLRDGAMLAEGTAIVQYLADLKPDRLLLAPVGSLTRYHTLEWLSYTASELHKVFTPLFKPATPEEYREIARKELLRKFSYLNEILRDRHWLTGAHFTVADAALFTVSRWAALQNLDISGLEHLQSWSARVAARPAVVAALTAEGLIK